MIRLPRIPSIPAEWRVRKMARSLSVLYGGLVCWMTLQTVNNLVSGEWGPGIPLAAFCAVSAASVLLLKCCESKACLYEAIEATIWCASSFMFNYILLLSDDPIYRHRGLMFNVLIPLLVPIMIAMRFYTFLVYAAWATCLNVATPYAISYMYGEDIPFRVQVFAIIAFGACLGVNFWQNSALLDLYAAETSLSFEKRCMESLTSMTCDATCWIAADKSTVKACDRRLDDLFGTDMTDKVLTDYIASEEETARFARTIGNKCENDDMPVTLLPINMRTEDNETLRLELYVVNHYVSAYESALSERSYFIGVRRVVQHTVSASAQNDDFPDASSLDSFDVLEEPRSPAQDAQETIAAVAPDERLSAQVSVRSGSIRSVPRTTGTGRVFKTTSLFEIKQLVGREHWCIRPADVKLCPDQVLGNGSFGVVVKGHFQGATVAVKLPHVRAGNSTALKQLANELRILRRAHHPNLVQFYGAIIDTQSNRVGLVLELASGVCLDAFTFSENEQEGILQRLDAMHDIANALAYLHSRVPVVVHGDLKPSNIFVAYRDAFVQAKLIDFGLSRVLTSGASRLGGTMRGWHQK
eukprot:TRINITY_DN23227_c0_g1_i1.p1 TRINITY_DN23227_c0_g1~~TRINITY_DN23227_c0_g1_i1.p1  ORF type:complete len:583 (+),score=51.71 TRINITY_DN23227_c0_g1_i1:47-1795(+)